MTEICPPRASIKVCQDARRGPFTQVILVNDDYPPREFFGTVRKLIRITLTKPIGDDDAHRRGAWLFAVYTKGRSPRPKRRALRKPAAAGLSTLFNDPCRGIAVEGAITGALHLPACRATLVVARVGSAPLAALAPDQRGLGPSLHVPLLRRSRATKGRP